MLFVKAVLFAALFMNCYCDVNNERKVVEVEKLLRYINSNAASAKQKAKSASLSNPSGQSVSLSATSYGGGGSRAFGSAPSAPSVYSYAASSPDNFYGVNMGQDDRLANNFFGGANQPGSGQVFCQDMHPIFEGEMPTEQYCRCSDGSYGITCTEGFGNPCLFGNSQFFPADPRLSRSYFIHCSWNIPHLKKCAANLFWNQDLLTCAWA